AIGRHELAGFLAPCGLGERFRLHRVAGHRGCQCCATTEECAAIVESVACCWNEIFHWITSSTRARKSLGNESPMAFAALRFTTNSILFTCITGRSAGRAPLSTRVA